MLIGERYRLLRLVGQGGMGRVWLARDEVLHRDVAVKEVALPDWLGGEEQDRLVARTLREARLTARLNHPNVVSVHDVVSVDSTPWIVMEYVPSRSLQDVLEAGPVSPRRAAQIGLAVLDALTAAHRAGVVHRDVKPGNVLMADDGRIMLTDFGLATLDDGRDGITRSGMIMGSPEYVAPERAAEGASTAATDLWSLGATLHAAVEGKSPYARSTAMATLTALATKPPDPAPHAGPLAPVLAGLLRRDPARRLTATEIERLLNSALDTTAVDDEPTVADWSGVGARLAALVRTEVKSGPEWAALSAAAEPGPPPGRARTEVIPAAGGEPGRHSRRWWWVTVTAAALAVVLAAVGTALALNRDRDGSPTVSASDAAGTSTPDPDRPGDGGGPGGRGGPPPGGAGIPPPPFPCIGPPRPDKVVIAGSPAPVGESYPPPDGWTWYTGPGGFRLTVPVGWVYFQDEGVSCFQDPRSVRSLSVDPATPAQLAADDPVGLLRGEERRGVNGGVLPKYHRVRLGRQDGRAEWDCQWTAPDGERMRSLRTVTAAGDRAYTLGWVGSDAEWAGDAAGLAAVRASFRPAP
ncbi:serine/threonine-protein kinase [Plantactinospora siamensis]|uniref:non-specific serine/threonine protein kinase n=1 Tax=Plantactinospora siamensis TaxID=555372 RepID=A0ABV6NQE9_9ACTN